MNLGFLVGIPRGKMILDKLFEKKDLLAYIDYRLQYLASILESEILKLPETERESLRQRFIERQRELRMLRKLITHNMVKSMSKKYFHEINKGVN